ncbi:MAG TPA: sigma-54 dependent transcriptional regulator [Acidobacteriota bacterium]|nr:sigma-54 dependent transcriptional regulator [Acidobacteriota bacterium]
MKPDNDNHIFRLAGNFDPEAILLYVICVDESITAFPLLKARFPNRPFLTLFENDESDSIFKILELGVDDFLTSPVKPCELRLRFKRLLDRFHHEDQFELSIKKKFGLKQLVGESKEFISEIKKIPLLAKCDATVLITGETGTGKELCARAIHYLSSRCRGPFVPVNCGAIPVDLVENELFGHERGAFTGALVSTSGLIQEAERGTLFLDEIDCLPLYSQVKLLRFLQEKEYRPLGANKMKRADVRLLAAMNVDPQEAVASGKLRQDLFYRLNVLPLIIPPLRNRREDIPLLARNFLHKYAMEFDKDASDFSPEAMQLLVLYDWPGNVRELEHIIERAVVLSKHSFIEASDISLPSFGSNSKESFNDAKIKMIAAFEKNYIERLLVAHHGNISQAARAAQKNRRAFWELLRKHRIDAGSFKI